MEFSTETSTRGVAERDFSISVGGTRVPGVMWAPDQQTEPRPVVLIGHGGTQHKRSPNVVSLGRRFVRRLGYVAVAIDAPEHGDRITDQDAADRARHSLEARLKGSGDVDQSAPWGGERPLVEDTAAAAEEWRHVLDHLAEDADLTDGRFGYWGLSMGTLIGLPFVASDSRLSAAVLGLAGVSRGASRLHDAAQRLRTPILFIVQWDDELVARQQALALYDAIGSPVKTAHINRGGHVGTPAFERDDIDAFFARHLGRAQ
ncbi:MAG TPA: hypothetical protein VFP54_08845 [Acidimicrobiales bacterium]|nr:hypothetical protein [Acidimicrobiales bacterium]